MLEIHAFDYINSVLSWSSTLRKVFDVENEDMDLVQSTWVKELIPLTNESKSRGLERWEDRRLRRMVEVEGVEMEEGVAGFVGLLVRNGLEGARRQVSASGVIDRRRNGMRLFP
jgi:hypothetical protein